MNKKLTGRYFALWLFAMVVFAGPVKALQVSDLYEAEVPVAGQDAAQRAEAISHALVQVLVKVTGHRGIGSRSELAPELRNASRYVQQYRYRLLDTPAVELAPAAGEETAEAVPAEPQRMLQVSFDSAAVNGMLRGLGLPVWGENRPGGLVWIGIEQNGKRQLLNPDADNGELSERIATGARSRGLPVIFPLMDLEDQANMGVADLWGDFESTIRNASQRYSPDLIMTGKLMRIAQGHWRSSWRLYHGDQVSSWEDQASDKESLTETAMQRVADLLSERFAPLGADFSMNRVRIRVDGVVDLQDYASLGRFFQSQSAVEKVELIAVEPDAMTYDLHTRGGTQVLQQGLDLGGLLIAAKSATPLDLSVEQGIDLYYRLR